MNNWADIRELTAEVEYFGIEVKPLQRSRGGSIQTADRLMKFTWNSSDALSAKLSSLPTSRRNCAHVIAAYLYYAYDDTRPLIGTRERARAEGRCWCRSHQGRAKAKHATEAEAIQVARTMEVELGRPVMAYRCPIGPWWHTTTQHTA